MCVLEGFYMWCCKFKSGDWIVSSLRHTQKGSTKAVCERLDYSKWKEAKNDGIRCEKVILTQDT